jgi:predicted Rossmann fold flavoprotein
MRIAIIGGGPSGLYTAIFLKLKHPGYDVLVFEKESKIARKLHATGNGHCNLLNKNLDPQKYFHSDYMSVLLSKYDYRYLNHLLNTLGVLTIEDGDLVYPLNYDAVTFSDFLVKKCLSLGVIFSQGEFLDYQKKDGKFLLTIDSQNPCKNLIFDVLILSFGGASTPKLGSDGRSFRCLESHGYDVVPLKPGLAPLIVEDGDSLAGLCGYRHHALVTLSQPSSKIDYKEEGEILFKVDALSGIVIFNVESQYVHWGCPAQTTLTVNYYPNITSDELFASLCHFAQTNPTFFFDAFLPETVQPHFLSRIDKKIGQEMNLSDLHKLALLLQSDAFMIAGTYGFDYSQVTIGGLDLSEVDDFLQAKKESGLFFAGELLDIDGFCGGYNLTWALLSAFLISKGI